MRPVHERIQVIDEAALRLRRRNKPRVGHHDGPAFYFYDLDVLGVVHPEIRAGVAVYPRGGKELRVAARKREVFFPAGLDASRGLRNAVLEIKPVEAQRAERRRA